jgi:hypothetical protein
MKAPPERRDAVASPRGAKRHTVAPLERITSAYQ